MKYLLIGFIFSLSAFAQDSIDINCTSTSDKAIKVKLTVGIHETSVDHYEINPATTKLVSTTDGDTVMTNPKVKSTDLSTDEGFLLTFDAYNGYDANFKRELTILINAGGLASYAPMHINDEQGDNKYQLLKCDKNLEELFGYIGF